MSNEKTDILNRKLHSFNRLKSLHRYFGKHNIFTLGDIIQYTRDELLTIERIGPGTIETVEDILLRHGLTLKIGKKKSPSEDIDTLHDGIDEDDLGLRIFQKVFNGMKPVMDTYLEDKLNSIINTVNLMNINLNTLKSNLDVSKDHSNRLSEGLTKQGEDLVKMKQFIEESRVKFEDKIKKLSIEFHSQNLPKINPKQVDMDSLFNKFTDDMKKTFHERFKDAT